MSEPAGNQTSGSNIAALERASGQSWATWLTVFAQHNASTLTHTEVARIAKSSMPDGVSNPEWWAQAAAIAYRQHTGARVPGQSSAGDFRVGVSRTVAHDRDAAIAQWITLFGESSHRGHTLTDVRQSRTQKRSFWRASLFDAGKVEAAAASQGAGRCTVTISHTGLLEADHIESWRAHWKVCLSKL
jgi:hypothetical protein